MSLDTYMMTKPYGCGKITRIFCSAIVPGGD
jgi:hypothetical protein